MKRKICCIVSFLLAVVSVCRAGEERMVLKTATGDIYGWLMMPEGVDSVDVVLIAGGSGPTDHDGNAPGMANNALRFLAADLAEAGIASLRFDKRGVAVSSAAGPSESDLRFGHYIDDVRGWIALLDEDSRFRHIFLAGHSEGAQIVAEAAADDSRVAGVILIAGMGRPAGSVIREQLAARAPSVLVREADAILDSLEAGRTVAKVSAPLYGLFRPDVQPYMISWLQYDPLRAVARLRVPVLVVQGDTDIQVGSEDAGMLAGANSRARRVVIGGMNHVLKLCKTKDMSVQAATYYDPDRPNHPELAEAVVSFISER